MDYAVTGEQIKGARAMLRLDQRQFAALTHITVGTLRRMERTPGPISATPAILAVICTSLLSAGVELIEAGSYSGMGGPGLRLKGVPVAPDDVIDLETAATEQAIEADRLPEVSKPAR